MAAASISAGAGWATLPLPTRSNARACVPRAPDDGFARARLIPRPSPMHGMTILERMPKPLGAALAIALTLAGGVLGGFVARYVRLPLPWLLGPLFATMAPSLTGAPVRLIPFRPPPGHDCPGPSR